MFFNIKHVSFLQVLVFECFCQLKAFDVGCFGFGFEESPHVGELQKQEPEGQPEHGGKQPAHTYSPHHNSKQKSSFLERH